MKHTIGILTMAMVLLLTGCASVPMAAMDQDAKAKEFSPAPTKASLYIYRNENFGAAMPLTVSVNGKTLGQTAAKTYFELNLMPGQYNVQSDAENISTLALSLEAGRNYFVWQEIKMGLWSARSLLQQVDESTGRAGVTESKLIASAVSGRDLAPLGTPIAAPSSPISPPQNASAADRLKELNQLYKDGLINEKDFDSKKQEILKSM